MGEEKRHEMMASLFGAQSEEDSDEEPEAAARPAQSYSEEEAEGGGEGEAESEGERLGSEPEKEESEAERAESEAEREESEGEREESEGREVDQPERFWTSERVRGRQQVSASGSEQSHEGPGAEDDYDEVEQVREPRQIGRGRRQVSASGSEHSHEGLGADDDYDEVEQAREPSEQSDDQRATGGVAEMRDVFGDSDEEEEQELEDGRGQELSPQASAEVVPSDDEVRRQKETRPEDIVLDEEEERDEGYDSEEEQRFEHRPREKLVGPPLRLEVPLRPPPAEPDKMNVVRVSNIMGIESKPFDPKTYTEEETFVTDEAGQKQRLRLEDNVARWRIVRNRDGSLAYESNARFVKWSDGSMQLLIGNEVLDISVQDAQQDQAHLFVRHGKGILQSQGRLLRKMKFMPSSLSSKSHRLLTALVDSRNKKIYKVKNVITNIDPEREKEEKEKLADLRIRNREDLQRKQEKINRKYTPVRERGEPQLSPGYLEGALDEEEEADGFTEGRRAMDARHFQEQLDAEDKAERRIMNAKKQPPPSREPLPKRPKEKTLPPPSRPELEDSFSDESEREASEFESDGGEENTGAHEEAEEEEAEADGEEEEEEEEEEAEDEDDDGREKQGFEEMQHEDRDDERSRKRRDREDDFRHEESPPRKPVQRRRVVVSDSEED